MGLFLARPSIGLPSSEVCLISVNVLLHLAQQLGVGARRLLVKGVGEAGRVESSLQGQSGHRVIEVVDLEGSFLESSHEVFQ